MASKFNDNNQDAHSQEGGAGHGRFQAQGDHHRQARYMPNEQETQVLLECKRDSFWRRALPFGLLTGTGVFMLIQRGILTTKTRFGPLPKVLFGGFFGYLLGKVSYISTCKQKFLKLENSPIAEMLRKGASPGAIAASTQFGSFSPQDNTNETMYTGGSGRKGNLGDDYTADMDIDTSYQGQDVSLESYDQSRVSESTSEVEEKRPDMTMTYDQLRKQNREKSSQQVLPGHFQRKSSAESTPPRLSQGQRADTDDEFTLGRSKKLRRNAYGDLISDE